MNGGTPPGDSGPLHVQIAEALAAHARWKTAFAQGLTSALVPDAAHVHLDDRCELGAWLASLRPEVLLTPECRRVVEHHAVFHAAAAEVASSVRAGRPENPGATLAADSRFGTASSALIAALELWATAVRAPRGSTAESLRPAL